MKIAILSDIHEGINRKNTQTNIMSILEKWITVHEPEVFIIGGDMTAKPDKALTLLNQLKQACPKTKIIFVHGNHDIYAENSVEAYKTLLQFPDNLGNGPIELNDDWVVIGDGGWYDYTHGMDNYSINDFKQGTYNNFTWPDKKYANWAESDQDVTKQYVQKLTNQLENYQNKKIIMVTHFVPFARFVQVKNDPGWDFFNAMMGSEEFGKLAKAYGVKKYIFGHIHTRYHENQGGMEIICNPLGYFPHEWTHTSPEKEINSTIKIIEI